MACDVDYVIYHMVAHRRSAKFKKSMDGDTPQTLSDHARMTRTLSSSLVLQTMPGPHRNLMIKIPAL